MPDDSDETADLPQSDSPPANERPSLDQQPQLLRTADVLAKFPITDRTLRRWVKRGRLPCVRVGRSQFFRAADVLALLEGDISKTACR